MKNRMVLVGHKGHCSIRVGDLDSGGVANLSWAGPVGYM